jgi:hypothetical protein
MRPWILIVASALPCMGCTTVSLNRNTLAQAASTEDLRYKEVLDGLAAVANDPAALPAYASVYSGTAQVTDTEQMISTTMWQHVKGMGPQNGFASEAANPQFTRSVSLNWSLDPIVVPEKLEAVRAACQWVLYGPGHLSGDGLSLLSSPDQAPTPGRHFGVADRLARMPPGWLHVGALKDVPVRACYKGHCGATWVWITPDGLEGLADFTIVVQDIARVSSNSPTLFAVPLPTSAVRVVTDTCDAVGPCGNPGAISALLTVDPMHRLAPAYPYYPLRVDNVSTESHFTSKISAASVSP